MVMQKLVIHLFWWLSNIALYIWTISSLPFCLLKGILALSTVWWLWPLLLWTLRYRCPFFSLHLYLWGKYPVVQLLGHRVALFLTSWGTSILFSRVVAPVSILTNSVGDSPFSSSSPTLFLVLVIFAILTGVRWHLNVVLIWISLIANDDEQTHEKMINISR